MGQVFTTTTPGNNNDGGGGDGDGGIQLPAWAVSLRGQPRVVSLVIDQGDEDYTGSFHNDWQLSFRLVAGGDDGGGWSWVSRPTPTTHRRLHLASLEPVEVWSCSSRLDSARLFDGMLENCKRGLLRFLGGTFGGGAIRRVTLQARRRAKTKAGRKTH